MLSIDPKLIEVGDWIEVEHPGVTGVHFFQITEFNADRGADRVAAGKMIDRDTNAVYSIVVDPTSHECLTVPWFPLGHHKNFEGHMLRATNG